MPMSGSPAGFGDGFDGQFMETHVAALVQLEMRRKVAGSGPAPIPGAWLCGSQYWRAICRWSTLALAVWVQRPTVRRSGLAAAVYFKSSSPTQDSR